MRAFLAIEIIDEIKEYLKNITNLMALHIDGVKWVDKTGLHITLKFLGEIEDKKISQIWESISYIENRYTPFDVTTKDIDAFPDKRKARVIITTLENGVDNIKNIYNDIDESLSYSGFKRETRSFTPHITLGRMKIPGSVHGKAFKDIERKGFTAGSITLFKSILRREGALYTPVWNLKLKGKEKLHYKDGHVTYNRDKSLSVTRGGIIR